MPAPKQSWFNAGLRFCGSCVGTLACWSVWLGLSASLASLVYVAIAKELSVPDFVLRRVEANLAKANLTIKFGRARFDPTGEILLEEVQLRSPQFEEPLLTSQLVFFRRSFWSILAGQSMPDEIRLEGATLQLPAMLSPSGTTEPLIRNLVAVVRHDENLWRIDQLAGHIGTLSFTAQGEVKSPAHASGTPPLSAEQILARFLQAGRRLVLAVNQFSAFDGPALAVRLENREGVGNTASLLFTALSAERPWSQPIVLGPLAVTGFVRLDGKTERSVRLYAATQRASDLNQSTAENVRAIISAEIIPESISVRPFEALVAAGTLIVEGEPVLGPVLRVDLGGWTQGQRVRATAAAQINGEFIAGEVAANLQEKSALARAEGRVSHKLISRILTKHTPRAAPFFLFHDPITFTAEATLSPGWKFDRLTSRVAADRLDSRGVNITAARGRIEIVGTRFLAHEARVTMGENAARGSYWMDFATTDYRMLLTGRMRPMEIEGWFNGGWWSKFWLAHFAFPAAPAEADVDMQGRWRDAARSEYFGRAEATGPVLLGAAFEQAQSLIFLRPHYTHGLEVSASRAGGAQRLAGSFKRFADHSGGGTNRLEFNINSNIEAAVCGQLLQGKLDPLLGTLRFTQPPSVHVEGAIEGKWPGAVPNYRFTGQAEGGLHYYGFPLETVRVAGGVTGGDLRLDEIQFTAAGGKGAGKAALNGPADFRRLGFDVYLNGADLTRTIRAVEEYQANRTGQKTGSVTESKFMKRASGGRLDVALSAQGKPEDLASFNGTGNAALTGAELGEVQLFGLLSQVLSGLSFNFSSLKLDAAHTSFRMERGRLVFPDLKITGPSAVIDARGDYVFATNDLDFTAKFKPFEESRTLLTGVIGLVVNRITNNLELKLTGRLSNPEWSVSVGSSTPRTEPSPPPEKPAEPTVPPGK